MTSSSSINNNYFNNLDKLSTEIEYQHVLNYIINNNISPSIYIPQFLKSLNINLIKYCLEHSINIYTNITIGEKDNFTTPLHYAIKICYLKNKNNKLCTKTNCICYDIVKLLIKNHAKINALDFEGNTPLHIALSYSCKCVIDYLIKYGAYINIINNYNETPVDYACQNYINNKKKYKLDIIKYFLNTYSPKITHSTVNSFKKNKIIYNLMSTYINTNSYNQHSKSTKNLTFSKISHSYKSKSKSKFKSTEKKTNTSKNIYYLKSQ